MKAKKNGRPEDFTEELGDKICELVATHTIGYMPLREMHPWLPDMSTVRAWRLKYESFSMKYLEAKRQQAQLMVEEIDDLIPANIVYYYDDKGNLRIDSPSASLAIAKANNRKWTAARLAPKIYGDQKKIEDLQAENAKCHQELAELREKLDKKNKKDY